MKRERFTWLALLVFFILSTTAFFLINGQKYHSESSLKIVEPLYKQKNEFVLYFAKDTCPTCQKTDKRLTLKQQLLQYPVYRIEINNEKNQAQLQKIINKNNIKKVPAFLFVQRETMKSIKESALFHQ